MNLLITQLGNKAIVARFLVSQINYTIMFVMQYPILSKFFVPEILNFYTRNLIKLHRPLKPTTIDLGIFFALHPEIEASGRATLNIV